MGYDNRLRNVVGQEGSYAYDAYGRRIQQVTTSGVINSFYDHAGQLVYQEDRDGTTHDYLYLQGHLVAIRDTTPMALRPVYASSYSGVY